MTPFLSKMITYCILTIYNMTNRNSHHIWYIILTICSYCFLRPRSRGVAQWSDTLVLLFKYMERLKLTFDTCHNPSYSYCKKNTEKEISLHNVQAYILRTLEIIIIRTFLCRFERWPYLGDNYSLNVFSAFEHYIICIELTVKIWRNFYK